MYKIKLFLLVTTFGCSPAFGQSGVNRTNQSCVTESIFVLALTPDTILVATQQRTIISQKVMALPEFGTVVRVPRHGVLDIDLKLEAKHRGEGYNDVLGFGMHVTYQYAKTVDGLDTAPAVSPNGWVGGTNIRDLRDHYGQVNIGSALQVVPGYYKFCVFASAHSTLTDAQNLAEVLVESGGRSLNTLRLSYKPGGRLLSKLPTITPNN